MVFNPWRPVRAMVSQPRVKQAEGLRHPGSPPNVQGLKTIAPCKGNTSSIGATPRRQTTANPNAERGNLACMSYAEVQPDFAEGNN